MSVCVCVSQSLSYEVYAYWAIIVNKQWALNFHLILFTVVSFHSICCVFFCAPHSIPLIELDNTEFGARFGIRNFFYYFHSSLSNIQFFCSISFVLVRPSIAYFRFVLMWIMHFIVKRTIQVVLSWLQKCFHQDKNKCTHFKINHTNKWAQKEKEREGVNHKMIIHGES